MIRLRFRKVFYLCCLFCFFSGCVQSSFRSNMCDGKVFIRTNGSGPITVWGVALQDGEEINVFYVFRHIYRNEIKVIALEGLTEDSVFDGCEKWVFSLDDDGSDIVLYPCGTQSWERVLFWCENKDIQKVPWQKVIEMFRNEYFYGFKVKAKSGESSGEIVLINVFGERQAQSLRIRKK